MKPGDPTRNIGFHLTATEYAELHRAMEHYRLPAARVLRMALAKLVRELPSPGRSWELDAENRPNE